MCIPLDITYWLDNCILIILQGVSYVTDVEGLKRKHFYNPAGTLSIYTPKYSEQNNIDVSWIFPVAWATLPANSIVTTINTAHVLFNMNTCYWVYEPGMHDAEQYQMGANFLHIHVFSLTVLFKLHNVCYMHINKVLSVIYKLIERDLEILSLCHYGPQERKWTC